MFLTHIADKRLIEIITGDLNGGTDNRTPQRNNCDIGSTTANIHNHVSTGLGNINSCTNRCCNRLFDNGYFTCTGLQSRIFNSLPLYLGNSARYTDRNTGLPECLPSHCLLNEIFHHLFCDAVIGNNTLTQRAYGNNIARRSSKHQSGILTNCHNLICISIKSHNRGLLKDDSSSSDVNKNTCCS